MSSPSSVLTLGLGSWGSPSLLMTLGFGVGVEVATVGGGGGGWWWPTEEGRKRGKKKRIKDPTPEEAPLYAPTRTAWDYRKIVKAYEKSQRAVPANYGLPTAVAATKRKKAQQDEELILLLLG